MVTSASEIDILRNVIDLLPKTYRKRTPNFKLVMDVLTYRTSHSGMTSAIQKCNELGIDPYANTLEGKGRCI